ncbi:2-phosphosulfolactate phosphatase [Paenibacillus cremeus]|uniref:Probable 2-phosphosulfolactate phosphatase n=1 Tax=Paenibacillus cremeus TaxID=2163881 RepID=A0A559KH79_9BACL|nr:2-phosphosulfolactate phosphatase [Paenibacillus cremeus]TVY11489.1 2-phosphosulfolactate phosphatase [Paenibacillus cremeus]
MNVQVISCVNEARAEDLSQKTVVVIDVLRATSTMLTALANGCHEVVPVETVLQAKSLQTEGTLLGGERFCKKIPGFDLGNSPLEYKSYQVAGKTVIITTTNGTRAIQKASKANHIVIGSMLNAKACAERMAQLDNEIAILCAGTQDLFSLEDGLCAGLIADELLRHLQAASGSPAQVSFNDFGLAMLNAYREVQHQLTDTLLSCANGKRLTKLGFKDDVLYCAQVNTLAIAPQVIGGKLEAIPACL